MNKKSIDFLDLGSQPLANSYLTKKNLHKKEKKYRLIVCFNKENKIVYHREYWDVGEEILLKIPFMKFMYSYIQKKLSLPQD